MLIMASSPSSESFIAMDISGHDAPKTGEAYDRIAALLEEESDNEASSDLADASPSKVAAMFSSSPRERVSTPAAAAFDLDLGDDSPVSAALLQQDEESSSHDGKQDDGDAAYARLKSLFSKPNSKPIQPIEASNVASKASSDDESEEDIPVKKNRNLKRKIATPRSSPARLPPRPATRSPSPGLFVSPAKSQASSPVADFQRNDASGSDQLPDNTMNPRLKELIAKKRAEREAKEQIRRKKQQRQRKEDAREQEKRGKQFSDVYSSELNDGMTEEAQETLTKISRPTQRKASKKAIEDMNRETQRMARNQQLTHQARVKTKHSTAEFVASFLGKSVDTSSGTEDERHVAMVSSDHEDNAARATPPSSPPSLPHSHIKPEQLPPMQPDEDEYIIRTGVKDDIMDDDLPSMEQIMSDPAHRLDKGKGKVTEPAETVKMDLTKPDSKASRKQVRVVLPERFSDAEDDDLQILPANKSRFAVFDKVPQGKTRESVSMMGLRALAHMSPPSKYGRKGKKPSVTQAELFRRLGQEMHKQTVAEKQERIEFLKSKGVVFRTDEEIEQDQLHIENMLEKARQEAMELGRKEKEAADQNGEEIDENYQLPSDDESEAAFDEDEEEGIEEEGDTELSGSEEEDADQDETDEQQIGGGMVDDAAEEADDDEAEDENDEGELDDKVQVEENESAQAAEEASSSPRVAKPRTKLRSRNIVIDDEDDIVPPTPTPALSAQSQSSPFVAFGFAPPQADLSLTQMFQGTMADLATQDDATQATPSGRGLDFLRDGPVTTMQDHSPLNPINGLLVPSSPANLLTPSKASGGSTAFHFPPQFPTPIAITSQRSPMKHSEDPEPTQDAGFESFRSAATPAPHSTVETVMLPLPESPVIAPRKGKLRRKLQSVSNPIEEEDQAAQSDADDDEADGEVNSFEALMRAQKALKSKVPITEFDKKNSKAKGMVEEQADESEDEYAGLGGASDDESDIEMDEEMQAMLDEGHVDVKETELAKFYAERDLAENEKNLEKLHRDLTTGALRRKRGAGGIDDLSDDSDDEAERKRQKTLAFQRQYRALVEDENIKKTGKPTMPYLTEPMLTSLQPRTQRERLSSRRFKIMRKVTTSIITWALKSWLPAKTRNCSQKGHSKKNCPSPSLQKRQLD